MEIKKGDFRKEIANASEHFILSASFMIIPVLNTTDINEKNLWAWYYEAGALAHNILLESTAWNLSANIIININIEILTSILEINQDKELPIFIIPIGKQKNIVNQHPSISINQPQKGLYLFGRKIIDLEKVWIIGPLQAEIKIDDGDYFKAVHIYIDGREVKFCTNTSSYINLPLQFLIKRKELTIKSYDYDGKSDIKSLEYIKIF
jgi:hypothetical protein